MKKSVCVHKRDANKTKLKIEGTYKFHWMMMRQIEMQYLFYFEGDYSDMLSDI